MHSVKKVTEICYLLEALKSKIFGKLIFYYCRGFHFDAGYELPRGSTRCFPGCLSGYQP